MWPIIKRTIKDRWMIFLIYIIAASAFLFMHTSIFPSFKDQQIDISKMLESMPKGFIDAFGLQDYDMSKFENYISGEEFSLIWPLLLLIMSISLAGGAIAAEVEKGTIEVLLSQPISRSKLYVARYISGLILIIGFVAITIILLILMAKAFGISVEISRFFTLAFVALLFAWAIYGIAMFLSSIFSDRGKVYFICAGLLFVMYAINIVSGLKENLKDLKYLSFFHYYVPNDLLIRNHLDTTSVWVFVSVAIVFSVAGLIVFNRRDIST
jgi:ABC-2 type transport system permease protein